MKNRYLVALISLLGLALVPGIASAHTVLGMSSGGFAAGLSHPFSGLDHMLAMFTVGLWAATLGGSASWKVPTAFVVMLLVGALLGMAGVQLPLVESVIALSVLVLGLTVTLALQVPASAGIVLVGLFAMFHGHAHGTELPEAVSGYMYLLGMTLASVVLHLSGFGIGHFLKQRQWLLRSGGALIAGAGVWLVASL